MDPLAGGGRCESRGGRRPTRISRAGFPRGEVRCEGVDIFAGAGARRHAGIHRRSERRVCKQHKGAHALAAADPWPRRLLFRGRAAGRALAARRRPFRRWPAAKKLGDRTLLARLRGSGMRMCAGCPSDRAGAASTGQVTQEASEAKRWRGKIRGPSWQRTSSSFFSRSSASAARNARSASFSSSLSSRSASLAWPRGRDRRHMISDKRGW